MYDFNVEVLSYDQGSGKYTVRYCIDNGNGTVRRTKATYFKGELSRDNDKAGLVKAVSHQVAVFAIRM